MALQWYKGTVVGILDETPNVKRFFVEIPELDRYDFVAGQFCCFELPIADEPRKSRRSYSIASTPNGSNVLEFIIVYLEGGAGTGYLFEQVKLGDQFPVSSPQGRLVLPEDISETELCMLCTGTGVAPFRSMLHFIKDNDLNHGPLKLVFGTRYITDILYYRELKQMEKELDQYEYHVALSRETDESWDGHRGYLHAVVDQLYPQPRPDVKFFLCGWKSMITEARKRLTEKGWDRKQIHFEIYG